VVCVGVWARVSAVAMAETPGQSRLFAGFSTSPLRIHYGRARILNVDGNPPPNQHATKKELLP
jgi:hypothetical protein